MEVRERVTWDLKEGVVGTDTFAPKHVAIVTWKNMSFAGGIDNSLFKVSLFFCHTLTYFIPLHNTSFFQKLLSYVSLYKDEHCVCFNI